LGVELPIIICSDADVLGYEFHGFAGSIRRPYRLEDIRRTLTRALGGGC
jgi:hypothetical protein